MNSSGGIDFSNPNVFPAARVGTLANIFNFIIPMISLVAAGFFLLMLMYAAFTWITAADNPDNIAKAWKTITFAVIGLIIVTFSYIVIKVLGVIIGFQSLPF